MLHWLLTLAHAGSPESAIEQVLDGMHQAASEADAERYFGSFTDDAVFLGTDPDERWTLAEFRDWAAPRFEEAPAWTYTPVARHVTVAPRGRVAWFDEQLQHATYGQVRGSGALVLAGKEWKVAHYVLSFAVPNEVAMHTVRVIQGEATLPTPFTAAQIRSGMPKGAFFRHERQSGDEPVVVTSWTVTAADAEGCTMATKGDDVGEQRATWTELRDHAVFPVAHTTVLDERIDTPVGSLDCRRYTVAPPPNKSGPTKKLWFCPEIPGAPVRMLVELDDRVVYRMELVERRMPR